MASKIERTALRRSLPTRDPKHVSPNVTDGHAVPVPFVRRRSVEHADVTPARTLCTHARSHAQERFAAADMSTRFDAQVALCVYAIEAQKKKAKKKEHEEEPPGKHEATLKRKMSRMGLSHLWRTRERNWGKNKKRRKTGFRQCIYPFDLSSNLVAFLVFFIACNQGMMKFFLIR